MSVARLFRFQQPGVADVAELGARIVSRDEFVQLPHVVHDELALLSSGRGDLLGLCRVVAFDVQPVPVAVQDLRQLPVVRVDVVREVVDVLISDDVFRRHVLPVSVEDVFLLRLRVQNLVHAVSVRLGQRRHDRVDSQVAHVCDMQHVVWSNCDRSRRMQQNLRREDFSGLEAFAVRLQTAALGLGSDIVIDRAVRGYFSNLICHLPIAFYDVQISVLCKRYVLWSIQNDLQRKHKSHE